MSTQTADPAAHGVTDLALRRTLLDAARGPVEETLQRPVRFKVDRLKVAGDAAFLLATMQDIHGRPVSFEGTPLAGAAREGFVSQTYAALLRLSDGRWSVAAKAIGPSDVAWEGWSREYGVPAALLMP